MHPNTLSKTLDLDVLRTQLRNKYGMREQDVMEELLVALSLTDEELCMIEQRAAALVRRLRDKNAPTMMESFLSEYGLSTPEGVGLMCLAEALLRVPDATTIDELIADKLESSDWAAHLGQSSSPLVNASTWALLLTGRLLDDGDHPTQSLATLLKRVGEPVVRKAVAQAMKLLGKQFVLGENIEQAISAAQKFERTGYTYSYDMLGEAAFTFHDAERYKQSYAHAIDQLAKVTGNTISSRPGISVKLSALHPRYEYSHKPTMMTAMLDSVHFLAAKAATAGVGFNIDAEEADRQDISLDIIESLLADPALGSWDGLGIVVQAYSRRALPLIEWLIAAAHKYDRKIMVRLVKGAYWDSEIKQAQELGLASFPVFTRKANTDVSYLACAERLLANRDRVYPQFATHNAHSVSAIVQMAGDDAESYEFQRLHGMGESLHDSVRTHDKTRCRIYAPVGAHRDLLAYLVRRLLENGANSSFVNQIVDLNISEKDVARCPVTEVRNTTSLVHPNIAPPMNLYHPERVNSKGFRINDPASITRLLDERDRYKTSQWSAVSALYATQDSTQSIPIHSPNDDSDVVGSFSPASQADVDNALLVAREFRQIWASTPMQTRSQALLAAADAYEEHTAEFCALLCREAGKTLNDAISEIREAVDFLRYYSVFANDYQHESSVADSNPHGVMVCISPWNFPLAIFTGQIAGALVSGNVVLAKPADQTPLVATKAVALLHAAGIPVNALQLILGTGATVGKQLTSAPSVSGVCFTGSTATSRLIERSLASRTQSDIYHGANANPLLMAETGGINAMIVDSSALTEQVVRDCIMSAFQSAGQRCSALRIVYVQKEAEQRLITMLTGAMDCLTMGNPWQLSTDLGPVIDEAAYNSISKYIAHQTLAGALIHQTQLPESVKTSTDSRKLWIAPTLIRVKGIHEMKQEIFGPVLHLATFEAKNLSAVVKEINTSGYGLTFGLHTRIDDRVQRVIDSINVGNVYVNRNQIGAVVGSQPFGGEGLSGTGPKAGGPWYIPRLMNVPANKNTVADDKTSELNGLILPGPTGESNHWRTVPRSLVLIINKDSALCDDARTLAISLGCKTIDISEADARSGLRSIIDEYDIAVVLAPEATQSQLLTYRKQLAEMNGPLIPLTNTITRPEQFLLERHVCVDTTAAGGNASLLGAAD
ncbi:MAG: RHH-type proline utilization regulon transcriptional repressor/proline dehydrogenase [bacterium]|jgi:RHH-type proline utilization regulon transcriptional repressor/proline dehydrogenase/delta 1-pyrroline-5-carboxylate dehydrogenase